MAIALRASSPAQASQANTSHTVTLGAAASAGDLLVLGVSINGTATISSVSDDINGSTGWTLVATASPFNATTHLYYRANTGAGTPTVTVTVSSNSWVYLAFAAYSGAATSSALVASAAGNNNNAAPDSGATGTGASVGDLVVGTLGHQSGTSTVGTNASGGGGALTGRVAGGTAFGEMGALADAIATQTGAQSTTFSLSAGQQWGCVAGVFAQAAGAAATAAPPIPRPPMHLLAR